MEVSRAADQSCVLVAISKMGSSSEHCIVRVPIFNISAEIYNVVAASEHLLLFILISFHGAFNSRYLLDVASQLDGDKIEIFLNETGSPALIKDPSDFDSIFVVMPMKG